MSLKNGTVRERLPQWRRDSNASPPRIPDDCHCAGRNGSHSFGKNASQTGDHTSLTAPRSQTSPWIGGMRAAMTVLRLRAVMCPIRQPNHVPNWTVLPRAAWDHWVMTKKMKPRKRVARSTLDSVRKEMARPRVAQSARKEEEEANHRAMKHDSFMHP